MNAEPFCSSRPSGARAAIAIFALSILFAPTLPAAEIKPLELQTIMRELGERMQSVTGAIANEDWQRVADTAPGIASHRAPPLGEKARIMAYLGGKAVEFREYDRQAHDAATRMGQAAAEKDGAGVIRAFAKVQEACLACHQAHRDSFRQHFYREQP